MSLDTDSTSSQWLPPVADQEQVSYLTQRFGLDSLIATVLARRGISKAEQLLYFEQYSLRYQHSPYLFTQMEAAVERILAARSAGQKVLIFGDKDCDGMCATALMYETLSHIGLDVSWQVPQGDEGYGLTTDAVEAFAQKGGSLLITVDCGIASGEEAALAHQRSIDVIVFDHHDPVPSVTEIVLSYAIVVDAKLALSGYPYSEISGCALSYKLAQAIRFSKSPWYKADVVLLDARVDERTKSVNIDCISCRNLAIKGRLHHTIAPDDATSSDAASSLRLFLKGHAILCWDAPRVRGALKSAFGESVNISLVDMRPLIGTLYPWAQSATIETLASKSRLVRYTSAGSESIYVDSFFNLFSTYATQSLTSSAEGSEWNDFDEVQLVALAAMADVMPMNGENRLFLKNALACMGDNQTVRSGLKELLSELGLLGYPVSSVDISWKLAPALNAAGRLGRADLGVRLFIEENARKREEIAHEILYLNEQRKDLTRAAQHIARFHTSDSMARTNQMLCFVYDERINKGVSGILAGHLVSQFHVPAIVATRVGSLVTGSMRSPKGFSSPEFLAQCADVLESYGGHTQAAGFKLAASDIERFRLRAESLAKRITLPNAQARPAPDLKISPKRLNAKLESLLNYFEPYGNEFPTLLFVTHGVKVVSSSIFGRNARQHLKLLVDTGSAKWPCIFWGEGERLSRTFKAGDSVDIIYSLERSWWTGTKSLDLILTDVRHTPAST